MPRLLKPLRLALMLSALGVTVFAQERRTPADDLADRSRQVDEIISRRVFKNGPGAAVLVVRDGEVVHQKGYGLANLEHEVPVTRQTVFELASVSKQFTAMAVMILADRGRLAFDDDVRKFLPELPAYSPERSIRVSDLLRHTSGIRDYIGLLPRAKTDQNKMKNKDVLKLLKDQTLVFPTGTEFRYSNSNYCLLALIVERITNKTYGRFMGEEIFRPLDMKGAVVFDSTELIIKHRAYGYDRTAWYRPLLRPSGSRPRYRYVHSDLVMTGDGGVMTSLEDMAGWDRGLATGKLVRPETLALAFTPGKLDNGKPHTYGFGWLVGGTKGHRVVSHEGGWVGYRTFIRRYLDDRLTVVVLSNNESLDVGSLGDQVAKLYLPGGERPKAK